MGTPPHRHAGGIQGPVAQAVLAATRIGDSDDGHPVSGRMKPPQQLVRGAWERMELHTAGLRVGCKPRQTSQANSCMHAAALCTLHWRGIVAALQRWQADVRRPDQMMSRMPRFPLNIMRTPTTCRA